MVMMRVMRLPEAGVVQLSQPVVEFGENLNLTLSDLQAPLIKTAGNYILDHNDQPPAAGHMRLTQAWIDGIELLQAPVELTGYNGLQVATSNLREGGHTIVMRLENSDAALYTYQRVTFEVAFTDSDYDGIQDHLDLWPNQPPTQKTITAMAFPILPNFCGGWQVLIPPLRST